MVSVIVRSFIGSYLDNGGYEISQERINGGRYLDIYVGLS